jgi:catechol-2,3-dioxygenase
VAGRRCELVREGVLKLWCEHAPVPTRLVYAILFVSDLDRAIGFYRDVIGVPLRCRADAYAEFATDGAKFATVHVADPDGNVVELTRAKRFA